jgi:hypothetical protein
VRCVVVLWRGEFWIARLKQSVHAVKKQIDVALKNNEMRPEHTAAKSDAETGVFVYKKRSEIVLGVLAVLCVAAIVQTPSAGALVFWCAFMYVYLDFYGGLLHFVLDDADNLKLPIISPGCLEFQWHHNIPQDITSQPFSEVAGALNVLACGKWAIVGSGAYYLWDTHHHVARTLLLVMGWGYFVRCVGIWRV